MRAFMLFGFFLSLVGCTMTHSRGPDGGLMGCEGFTGEEGAACDFEGSCAVDGLPYSECCSTALSCVEGRAVYTNDCPTPDSSPWQSCEDYLMAGACDPLDLPGAACDVATFGVCPLSFPSEPPCAAAVTCVDGVVVEGCSTSPVVSCTDAVAPPMDTPLCRASDECGAGEYCYRTGEVSCGPCMVPSRECEADPDCGAANHCEAYRPACSCGGEATRCVPDCATNDDCASGEVCGSDGVCEATSCGDGYACPENMRCGGTGDEHGCSRLSCAADAECDCGFCVERACVSDLGTCSLPAA